VTDKVRRLSNGQIVTELAPGLVVIGEDSRLGSKEYLDQPYVTRLRALYNACSPKPGEIYMADVRHDPGCPALSGGMCNCDPDVSLRVLRFPPRQRRGKK